MQIPASAWVLIGGVVIALLGWLRAVRSMQNTARNPSTAQLQIGQSRRSVIVMAGGIVIVWVGIALLVLDVVGS